MPEVTYNIIIRKPENDSVNHLNKVKALLESYGASGRAILVSGKSLTIRVIDFDGPLETGVNDGRPFGQLQDVIREYEARIGQTDTPRWVISPPRAVDKVTKGLKKSGLMKDGNYFSVEVGNVYNYRTPLIKIQSDMPMETRNDVGTQNDILAELILTVKAEQAQSEARRKELAQLIKF